MLAHALFVFQGCSDDQAGGPKGGNAIPGWNLFQRPFFSIQYPPNWQLDSTTTAAQFFLYAPQDANPDPYRENVHLVVQELAGMSLNLDGYIALSEEQIKTQLTEGKLLESRREEANGTRYHIVVYESMQNGVRLKFASYAWVIKEKAFLLTLTCRPEAFDTYAKVGDQIMKSFVVNL